MPSSQLPVIDVSRLASGNVGDTAKVAAEIGAACRDIGFFYVAGHPVPQSLMDGTFAASAAFFAKDEAAKRSVLYTASGNRGYVPMKGEALDPGRPADLREAFNIGLELPVVSPAGRQRYSIAFFLDPNPDADIACLPNCATAERSARYGPIRGDAFLLSRLSPTYEKSGLGETPRAESEAG